MAHTGYPRTGDDPPRERAGVGEAIAVGLATVALVGALALVAHRFVTGLQVADVWRFGAVFAAGGIAWLVLRPRRRDASRSPARPPAVLRRGVRRHRRLVPKHTTTTVTTLDGRAITARIIDVSLGGVAVEVRLTEHDFASVARVGSRAAGPVRHTPSSAVFTFKTLLDPVIVNENLVL